MMHNTKSLLKDALLILLLLAGGTQPTTTQSDSTEVDFPMKDLTQDIGAFPSDDHPRVHQKMHQILGKRSMEEDETCYPGDVYIWYESELEAIGNETLTMLMDLSIFDLADFYNLFRPPDPNEYVFHDGSLTSTLNTLHQKVQSFWDIPSNDIAIMGMHGQVLNDIDTLAGIYSNLIFASMTDDELYENAIKAQSLIESTIGFDHPLLTADVYAVSAEILPAWLKAHSNISNIQDRIVFGDGFLEYFDSIGLKETSAHFLHAREFGVHIQLERGIIGDNATLFTLVPYEYRTSELMADAFAGYYLAHPNGGNFNRDMIEDVYKVVSNIGDCNFNEDFNNPGYSRGTSAQRLSAVEFGISLVEKKGKMAKKKGKKSKGVKGKQNANILSSTDFIELFYDAMPTIINPPSRKKKAKQHDKVKGYK